MIVHSLTLVYTLVYLRLLKWAESHWEQPESEMRVDLEGNCWSVVSVQCSKIWAPWRGHSPPLARQYIEATHQDWRQAPDTIHPNTVLWATGSPSCKFRSPGWIICRYTSDPSTREMVAGRWNCSSASLMSLNLARNSVRIHRLGSNFRTVSIWKLPDLDLMVVEQTFSFAVLVGQAIVAIFVSQDCSETLLGTEPQESVAFP